MTLPDAGGVEIPLSRRNVYTFNFGGARHQFMESAGSSAIETRIEWLNDATWEELTPWTAGGSPDTLVVSIAPQFPEAIPEVDSDDIQVRAMIRGDGLTTTTIRWLLLELRQ